MAFRKFRDLESWKLAVAEAGLVIIDEPSTAGCPYSETLCACKPLTEEDLHAGRNLEDQPSLGIFVADGADPSALGFLSDDPEEFQEWFEDDSSF